MFGSPKNTKGYQFSKTFFGVIFENNPKLRGNPFHQNMPHPCRMRGLQLVNSWSSRPGEQLACLPKCVEDTGQKEVSCAGLRGRMLGAAVPHGGGGLPSAWLSPRTTFVGCSLIFYYSLFCICLHFRAHTVDCHNVLYTLRSRKGPMSADTSMLLYNGSPPPASVPHPSHDIAVPLVLRFGDTGEFYVSVFLFWRGSSCFFSFVWP